jgi:hypothetical protein
MKEVCVNIRFNDSATLQTDDPSTTLLKILPADTFQQTELLVKESGNFIECKTTT